MTVFEQFCEKMAAMAKRFSRPAKKEQNQGYEIIAAETHATANTGRQYRVVLGRMETKYGTRYVTWDSTAGGASYVDYFWGHYYDDEREARADYHRRLMEEYER